MVKLILSNILQRPTRTGVSILAVALGVALLLVSVGLSYGQLMDAAERAKGMGGDFILQPSDASFFFALNSGNLDARMTRVIDRVEGVQASTPVLVKFLGERFHVVYGIEQESFERVNSTLTFSQGRIFQQPREAIIDTIYARQWNLRVGDALELLGNDFTVSGVYRQGVGARVLLPLRTVQELNGTPNKATMFFIRAREGRNLEEVYAALQARMDGYKITKSAELQEIMMDNTPAFREFVRSMVFISVGISFMIILLAMYSTIMERTREIGILKSLGASKAYIIRLILKESMLICSLGAVLGFALTYATIELIVTAFPNLPVIISTHWRVGAALMAVGGGTLGALYPAVKAAHMDPVRALGYE